MIAIVYSCADDGLQRKWDEDGERKASAFSLRTRVLCGVSRRPWTFLRFVLRKSERARNGMPRITAL
jgi:hypothetical protein